MSIINIKNKLRKGYTNALFLLKKIFKIEKIKNYLA